MRLNIAQYGLRGPVRRSDDVWAKKVSADTSAGGDVRKQAVKNLQIRYRIIMVTKAVCEAAKLVPGSRIVGRTKSAQKLIIRLLHSV